MTIPRPIAYVPDEMLTHRQFVVNLLGVAHVDRDDLARRAARANWGLVLELAGLSLHPMLGYRAAERGIVLPDWVRTRLENARRANAGRFHNEGDSMKFTVRKRNGKTSYRLQIGKLAITVEYPP